ncbi:MAG: putative HTH transcriptional regulator [Oleiphilaceae bacterium]|jgi:predicted HTH transcriptional regulator
MSNKINETESGWLKNILKENLWFIILLSPLVVVAVLIAQNVQVSNKQSSHRGIAMDVGSVEISAFELASIVTKPFSELLAMDVYTKIDYKYRSATLASLSNKKVNFRRKAYKHSYDSQSAGDEPAKLLSYEIVSKYKQQKRENESS